MTTTMMDFDAALVKVGDFGLYQKFLCAFLVVPSASLCALVYFTQFFMIEVPNHRCKIAGITGFNDDNISLHVPFEHRDGQYWPKQCEMYANLTPGDANGTVGERATVPCTGGWDYDFSELFPTFSTEMNWVCHNDRMPYLIQTIFFIGTSIGSILFGFIADRFGRRYSIVLSYSIGCLTGVLSGFVNTVETFAVLRFLMGACILPLSEDPYVLSLEYIGVKRRTLAIVLWAAGYISFSAICPWLAYGLKDVKWLCVVTSLPLIIVPLTTAWIPESASWLLTQGRVKEAVGYLKQVAKVNGRDFPEELECYSEDEVKVEPENSASCLDLFQTPRLRCNSLILAATWCVVYCCYHTNTQNASNLGTNIYESFTYSALVEIPAQFVILFGIDWLGRRWPMVLASLVAALAGFFIMCVPKDSPTTFLTLALVQRVTLTVVYNIIIQYSAELYPTVVRGRGIAFLRFTGTLGLYISPSIVYLALADQALPLLVSGCLMFGIAIIGIFLPETLDRNLPHSIEDAENFGKDQSIFEFPCIEKRKSIVELKEEHNDQL